MLSRTRLLEQSEETPCQAMTATSATWKLNTPIHGHGSDTLCASHLQSFWAQVSVVSFHCQYLTQSDCRSCRLQCSSSCSVPVSRFNISCHSILTSSAHLAVLSKEALPQLAIWLTNTLLRPPLAHFTLCPPFPWRLYRGSLTSLETYMYMFSMIRTIPTVSLSHSAGE